METMINYNQKIITNKLADAISLFNIEQVAELLAENGEFCIQDEKEEIVISHKTNFISWLNRCFDEFQSFNDNRQKMDYILDVCLHCRIGNPVIIFENGKFPIFTRDPWEKEKCGLMLEFDDSKISGITFCFAFLKTENLSLYEKKCTRSGR